MSRPMALQRKDRWLILALGAVLFLPCLGARDVWNPDEARYAQVAREMAAGSQVVVPRLNGELYGEKPPVFFWTVRLAAWMPTGIDDLGWGARDSTLGEIDEVAVRLPSALAATGCLLLIFSLGLQLFDRRAAWIAVLAFATCYKVLWQASFGQIDMLLAFWVTLEMSLFLRGFLATEPGPRRWSYRGFFVVGAVATATKGPAGFLPPLLAILAFLLLSGKGSEVHRLRPGRGLLLWAGVLLAWLVPAALEGGWEYIEHLVWRQSVTRFADPWHHHQPWWYYLAVLPVEFLPWSVFLPAVGLEAFRTLRRSTASPCTTPARWTGWLFALCWFGVTLVFFSVSPAKRTVYILPLYPALALMVGAALATVARRSDADGTGRWVRSWISRPLAIWALVTTGILTAVAILGPDRPELETFGPGLLHATLAALAVVASLSWAAWWSARGGRWPRALATLGAAVGIFWLIATCVLLPRLDVTKSARQLATEMTTRVQPGEPWTVYPRLDAGFLFYGGLPPAHRLPGEGTAAAEIASLRRFLARPERVWLVGRRDRLGEVEDLPPLWQVAEDRDPRKGYLLLTNRSHPEGRRFSRPPVR